MKMKKLFAVLLSVMMLLAMGTTAFAASGTNTSDGKITVTNPVAGETYNVYQMFVLESYDSDSGAYAYTIDSTSDWYNFVNTDGAGASYVTLEQMSGDTTKYYVTWTSDSADTAAFAKAALKYAKDNNITATKTSDKVAEDATSVVFDNLNLGYYLVDSSLGALVMLNTTAKEITIQEKNSAPTVDKQVQEDSKVGQDGEYGTSNTAGITDTVTFKTTITVGAGAESYVLHDTMTEGLTFNEKSVTVVKYAVAENLTSFADGTDYYTYDSTTGTYKAVDKATTTAPDANTTYYTRKDLTANTDYTLKTTDFSEESDPKCTFELSFTETCLNGLNEGDILVVTYTATVNENAVIDGTDNTNTTYLSYGDGSETTSSTTTTYVYDVDIFKYTTKDGSEVSLPGASFVLYKTVDGTNYYAKVENGKLTGWTKNSSSDCKEDKNDNTYATTLTSNDEGKISVDGLDADTYYLEETAAPNGYNKLAEPVEFIITSEGKVTDKSNSALTNDTVKIENKTGSELPSTGGIGTTIFYIVGSLLVVGAVIFFVVRRRMRAEKQAD